MPTSQQRSRYEEGLARAHRTLFFTRKSAEDLGDEGAAEDLDALMDHLQRMMDDSLKNRPRPRRQLSLPTS